MNSRILSENQGVTYIGCYFRGLWDKAGDMTMPEFLNNTDIVDMNCVFLNCRIGEHWLIQIGTKPVIIIIIERLH